MSDLFWLTDAQMARLAPFFPRSHGKPAHSDASGRLFRQHPVSHSGASGQLRIIAARHVF